MTPNLVNLLKQAGIAAQANEQRIEIAEAAKEVAEAERDAEKERADVQQRRADALQEDNAILMKRAQDYLVNLKIEENEKLQAKGIVEQLKKLIAEVTAEKLYAEKETVEKEVELAEAYASIQRLKEALEEEQQRHAFTEDDRDKFQKERDALSKQVEDAANKILKLEADKSLNKCLVNEHLLCDRCHMPYRKWDRKSERYVCLGCGE